MPRQRGGFVFRAVSDDGAVRYSDTILGHEPGAEVDIDLLAAGALAGILAAWLVTYSWARREIERAARYGDRRLRSAEFAAEEYRRELEALREQLAASAFSPGSPAGDGANGDRSGGRAFVRGNGNGSSDRDDLKRIRGIGARLESQLRDIDVTSFAQIAAWSDEDIDTVASRLRVFPGRIRRDGWVEGARRAHLEKYGREPPRHLSGDSRSVSS